MRSGASFGTIIDENSIGWNSNRNALEALIIYVNDDQLAEVEYLLHQSTLGNHLLFDTATIRRVAPAIDREPSSCEDKSRTEVAERLLEELILCPTIESKRDFLASLDLEIYDEVAKVYLRIVQNQVSESPLRH